MSRPRAGGRGRSLAAGGGVQANTQVGGGGVSRPRRGGGLSQHALRQTPPSRRLLRTVRIVLDCILVVN